MADLWQSRFKAVPRLGNDGFQNFHLQFIGRYNCSWTTFWTTAPCIFVYNCMWQHYSWTFSFTIACGNITVGLRFGLRLPAISFTIACGNAALLSGMSRFSRKPFPRIALENRLRGPLMDFKNHLMKSTTVSINRDLNETLIIFTTGLSNRRTFNLQASMAFC